jgi:arylsulfatase A-like enzyme
MFEPYADAHIPEPRIAQREWEDKPEPLRGMIRQREDWSMDDFIDYRRHFYAMVTGVDMAVGHLLGELEEQGELDDTLIVFGSDHGDACGDHGRLGKSPTFYDSIMRMPWVLHWPNGLPEGGRRIRGMVEMVDILPTLVGLAGGNCPPEVRGRSYAGELRDGTPVDGRGDVYAVHADGQMMLRTETAKYIRYPNRSTGREVLYDLDEDPGEFRNVATDPSRAGLLNELRERALDRTLDASTSIRPRRLRF